MNVYKVIFYWSHDDVCCLVEVPELTGCAADGLTRREAVANVEVVAGEWLETARELGLPVPDYS